MADKKQGASKGETDQNLLEKVNNFVDSPIKLFVFCTALLLISLTTGMLVGNAVKESPSVSAVSETPSETATKIEKQSEGIISSTAPLGKKPADNQGIQATDALDYNPTVGARAPEDQSNTDIKIDDRVIASLPPEKDNLNEPPWKRYAAASTPANGRPVIAMVIDDVGMNKGRVKALAELPNIVTLAFLPYANGLKSSVQLIRESGHEAMLHLPMEPLGAGFDPGPNALLNSLSLEEIRKRTLENLNRFDGYVGVNNHMGSKFTAFGPGMEVVMNVLSEKGLLFLDSRTISDSKGYDLAKAHKIPTGTRDVFIDNEINEPAILKQLAEVEALALKNGMAIAIGHPHLETISALTKWMPKAVEKGFLFIPISAALTSKIKQ